MGIVSNTIKNARQTFHYGWDNRHFMMLTYGAYRAAGTYTDIVTCDKPWLVAIGEFAAKTPLYAIEAITWIPKTLIGLATHSLYSGIYPHNVYGLRWLHNFAEVGAGTKHLIEMMPYVSPQDAQNAIDFMNNHHVNPLNLGIGAACMLYAMSGNYKNAVKKIYSKSKTHQINTQPKTLEHFVNEQ